MNPDRTPILTVPRKTVEGWLTVFCSVRSYDCTQVEIPELMAYLTECAALHAVNASMKNREARKAPE